MHFQITICLMQLVILLRRLEFKGLFDNHVTVHLLNSYFSKRFPLIPYFPLLLMKLFDLLFVDISFCGDDVRHALF